LSGLPRISWVGPALFTLVDGVGPSPVVPQGKPSKDARRGRCHYSHLLETGFWPLWMTQLPRNYSHKSQVTRRSTTVRTRKCRALCLMSRLIHTGLGSSSLIAHVLHSPPPPPANSFVIGPAVINTHKALPKSFPSNTKPEQ
jgi:hypothetical protein